MLDFIKQIQTAEASLNVKLNSIKKYNVVVGKMRTSVTLEPIVWEVLNEISAKQNCTVYELCSFINERKKPGANLSSAIRVFLLSYLFIHYKEVDHGQNTDFRR